MRLSYLRLIVLSSVLAGFVATNAFAEDYENDGTGRLVGEDVGDTSSSKRGSSSGPESRRSTREKSRWETALDAFEGKNDFYKSKRQTTYFDGSFTFGKNKFSTVTLDYTKGQVDYNKVAADVLGKGGVLLSAEPAAGRNKVQVQFLVPNEMVSFFVADEAAKRGASFQDVEISEDGRIPLKLQFDEPREDLGTDPNGEIEIYLTLKEYRSLHHKRWEAGKISESAVKKLLSKRVKGRLIRRGLDLPKISLAGPYANLPPRAPLLRRLLMLPKKARGAWIQRSPKALAKYRAKLYYKERVKHAETEFENDKRHYADIIKNIESSDKIRIEEQSAEANAELNRDKLLGKLGRKARNKKYRAEMDRIKTEEASLKKRLKALKAETSETTKAKYKSMLAKAEADKKKSESPRRSHVPRSAGKHAERQKKARQAKSRR